MKVKVSVVVPVYNVEKYIDECLDSILTQSLKDIEIILVDDGSDDNSGKILDNYGIKDDRVQIVHEENGGVSKARNKGLSLCTGDYVYIMDSDDFLELNALEIMYYNAIKTGADVIITDHYTFKEDNQQLEHHFFSNTFVTEDKNIIQQIQEMVLHPNYSPYLTNENTGLGLAAPWTKLLKRELITENHLTFDSFVQGIFDDGLFSLNVLEYASKVSYIRDLTYHYRMLDSSLIHRYNPKRIDIDKKVFQRIEEFAINYNKDDSFMKAYYARVIMYMVRSFDYYFFSKQNKDNLMKNYSEFKSMMKDEPYNMAIKEAEMTKLKLREQKVTNLARMHLYFPIWVRFKFRESIKGTKRS